MRFGSYLALVTPKGTTGGCTKKLTGKERRQTCDLIPASIRNVVIFPLSAQSPPLLPSCNVYDTDILTYD